MKISCQSCQAKYTIADEKVVGKIVKIRCKKCGATIVINGNESGAQTSSSVSGADAQAFDYAASAGGEQWTVNVADGDQRTMSFEEIAAALKSGIVNDETYCWKDGMGDWLPIREIPELASAMSEASAPAPAMADQTHQEPAAGTYDPPQPAFPAPAYSTGGADQDEATMAGYSGYAGGGGPPRRATAPEEMGRPTASSARARRPPPRRPAGRGAPERRICSVAHRKPVGRTT